VPGQTNLLFLLSGNKGVGKPGNLRSPQGGQIILNMCCLNLLISTKVLLGTSHIGINDDILDGFDRCFCKKGGVDCRNPTRHNPSCQILRATVPGAGAADLKLQPRSVPPQAHAPPDQALELFQALCLYQQHFPCPRKGFSRKKTKIKSKFCFVGKMFYARIT